MKEVKALKGQTLLDIAVQELGDASRVMELSVLNDISVTTPLNAGQMISVPAADSSKRSVVQIFTDKSNAPASNDISGEVSVSQEGIGFWKIGQDFIIQ